LAQQVQSGQATVPQAVIGTARNIQGITIGLRMMTAIEVHPGEFIVMSILDFSQAAIGNYNSTEERAVAITRSFIQNGVSLFLMYISQIMMRSQNWVVVAAGFGINFLTGPIMMLLDAVGVFDAVERAAAFLPSEVTEANQRLRELVGQYQ